MVIWLVGPSASGKTTLARLVAERLRTARRAAAGANGVIVVDGDEVRALVGAVGEGDYTMDARRANADRMAGLCAWLERQGTDVVCAIQCLFDDRLERNRREFSRYFEVSIEVPFALLQRRDRKDLYAPALRGERANVVGVDIPWTPPPAPDWVVDNSEDDRDLGPVADEIVQRALGHVSVR